MTVKLATILCLILLLAGCGSLPQVASSNRDEVIIQHDLFLQNAQDLQPQADRECARWGKQAIFASYRLDQYYRYARYQCQ